MKCIKILIWILFSGIIFSSCLLINSARSIQVEIMKPGMFTIPDSIHSIGIINRIISSYDTIPFEYIRNGRIISDPTVKYSELLANCSNALDEFLKGENYFTQVKNFNDSINSSIQVGKPLNNQQELFQVSNSDMLVILNDCKFELTSANLESDILVTIATLHWIIGNKGDTVSYLYNQADTLIYDSDPVLNFNKNAHNALESSATYLGRNFGTKIIPFWLKVERMYYKSNNPEMIKAEKFAMNNEWLKAANIWNKLSKNKNAKIAAKASFNMALACEMEGKVGVAIDWLVQSYSGVTASEEAHQDNCKHYINVLALRKKELDKLEKQVRMQ